MLTILKSLFRGGKTGSLPPDPAARVDALYAHARAAWSDQDYSSAATLAAEAIGIDPRLPTLHFMRANALLELGDLGGCVEAACAGLALQPAQPLRNELLLRWALARARQGAPAGTTASQPPTLPETCPSVSVIICSISEEKLDKVTRNFTGLLAAVPYEIIAIRDAKSLCEGYNRGARQSRGDILVFSHDDIEIISEDFAAQLLAAMQGHDLVGIAGTTQLRRGAWHCSGWPYLQGQVGMPSRNGEIMVTLFNAVERYSEGVQTLDGVFMAARRELVSALPFDEVTFDGWHLYDLDFSWRASRAGYRCATLNSLLIVHQSSGNFGEEFQRYMARFLDKHGADILPEGEARQPALSYLPVRSAAEWRAMTDQLLGAGEQLGGA